MEEEIAKLEEEASVACKAYDEVVEIRDRLDGENTQVGWLPSKDLQDCSLLLSSDGGGQEVDDGSDRGRAGRSLFLPKRLGHRLRGQEPQRE